MTLGAGDDEVGLAVAVHVTRDYVLGPADHGQGRARSGLERGLGATGAAAHGRRRGQRPEEDEHVHHNLRQVGDGRPPCRGESNPPRSSSRCCFFLFQSTGLLCCTGSCPITDCRPLLPRGELPAGRAPRVRLRRRVQGFDGGHDRWRFGDGRRGVRRVTSPVRVPVAEVRDGAGPVRRRRAGEVTRRVVERTVAAVWGCVAVLLRKEVVFDGRGHRGRHSIPSAG